MKQITHEMVDVEVETAILVSLFTSEQKREGSDPAVSMEELVRLAETAGVQVLQTVTQNKDKIDNKWFIGKGKAQELKVILEELGASTAIFDQELSGSQVRNLEELLDVKIIDRTQLILDIFAQRAKTREGIMQVELAQLSYLLPRLSGQGKNLSRLGGGIGTRGPGESKLETDRRHIRGRIDELKSQLKEVARHRTLHRVRRKKTGVLQVALVGYTNAGKSTLLRQLTDADVHAENKLFVTLDPTSRSFQLPSGKEILLTDTVGFIQNLPHDVIAAFRATLEEVCEADLILHVVDSSSAGRTGQMEVVQEVLEKLGAHHKEQIVIFNKVDLCEAADRELLSAPGVFLRISAFDPHDLAKIGQAVEDNLLGESLLFQFPADKGHLIALVYRVGQVINQEVDGDQIQIKVKVNRTDYTKNAYLLEPYQVQ